MSENQENQDQPGLEQGTYEIIRNRLGKYGTDLKSRLASLNEQRKAIFGGVETKLVATEHITTDHSCEARDMVPIGDRFIFGYNVHIGLKTETVIEDVFSVYEYKDRSFHTGSTSMLKDETFIKDFKNLYKYYRDARFSQFIVKNGYLYFVFQIGKSITDIKTFKWLIQPDTSLKYVDSRSEHEVRQPDQHGFDWKRPTADDHVSGLHPHISIEDRVFVETVGGDLTIKIENNTESGLGIYAEPVDNKDQTLNDADVSYAIIGDIIVLRIIPYQEQQERYIIYNDRIKEALRVDALKEACILLPEDQGIIFPQGYYLQSGEYKLFDFAFEGLGFEKSIPSSNGEDFLYVFYNPELGGYTLLIYNIIEQQLASPIHCSGYSIFDNGEMCLFRSEATAKKHHSIQIWETPFSHVDKVQNTNQDAYLFKVGNKEVVTAMAECRSIIKLIDREEAYGTLYVDLSKMARVTLDAYHWISHPEASELSIPLEQIESTAKSAIAEFDKVLSLKKNAESEIDALDQKLDSVRQKAKSAAYSDVQHFVDTLTNLRSLRGELITSKETRYIDTARIDAMEEAVLALQEEYSKACVDFLLTDNALQPYEEKVDNIEAKLKEITKVIEADDLDVEIAKVSGELEMMIEIVNSLDIKDSTVTTKIIDNITDIFYRFNRIIADLKKKRKSIFGTEAESEFNSQLKLIQQGASNYINLSDTPTKSEDYLNRMIIQLEDLEGKFSDFPEFGVQIADVREEISNAFESHKLALVEERNNRAVAIQRSAERIIQGITNRLKQYKTVDEINAYIASDALVQKVRDNIEKLVEIDDSVKADELKSQLKSVRENALRQLRDKEELFAEGEDVIKLGTHHFSVNTKKLDVTLVQRGDEMNYHLTGTNFFEPITDEQFLETQPFWDQQFVSENQEIYRAEYLAYVIFDTLTQTKSCTFGEQVLSIDEVLVKTEKELAQLIQQFMNDRYDERYIKGIHDVDAAKILNALLKMQQEVDLLVFSPKLRAEARFFWNFEISTEEQENWKKRLKAYGLMRTAFDSSDVPDDIRFELEELIFDRTQSKNAGVVAEYLYMELGDNDYFVISPEANELTQRFKKWLKSTKFEKRLNDSMKELSDSSRYQLELIQEWLRRFISLEEAHELMVALQESAVSLLVNNPKKEKLVDVRVNIELTEMAGEHPRLDNGFLAVDYHTWKQRLDHYHKSVVPNYREYVDLKHQQIVSFKDEMKLESFNPKVMTSFVRNQLIDQVYLPLIGNNMAKQIGVVGDNKRTDLMGMLLLISPPGYGKTTLMEYIAQRIGLIFVKINGPALGHEVTSVDPMAAPNSAAREELNRLNLAFEMGDNIMIYLDDIQHCHSEFLQKFISLCDGQRKIEGVYKGKNKTYDFRGRKVMVVMAGNPYTESGERFQIPDMLANRSDIYNLGDVIGGKREVFELSYIENCLTSNAILSQLNNKSFKDVRTLIKVAMEGPQESLDLEANHSSEEIEDYVNLLKRVLTIRDIVFKVNMEYITSASMEDQYRTAPPFKLQGSYRDMNKIVEKLVPVMNDEELDTLIISHYENEAQTLTSAAESSLLRFKELFGSITPEEQQRWDDIKETFVKNNRNPGGSKNVQFIIDEMKGIAKSLKGIDHTISGRTSG
jgi:MoxR-like ATPase